MAHAGVVWEDEGQAGGPQWAPRAHLGTKVALRQEEEDYLRSIDVALQRANILQIIDLIADASSGEGARPSL